MKKYLYILLLLFAGATFPPGLFGQNLSVSGQAAFDRGTLWTGEHATNTGLNLSFGFTF